MLFFFMFYNQIKVDLLHLGCVMETDWQHSTSFEHKFMQNEGNQFDPVTTRREVQPDILAKSIEDRWDACRLTIYYTARKIK